MNHTPVDAFVNLSLLEIPIIFACHQSLSQRAVLLVEKILIVNMEFLEAFVFVTWAVMEILMKAVDNKSKICAQKQLVEKELNVAKVSTHWNVCAHQAIMEIHIFHAMMSMNVHQKFAVKMQFVSTHLEAMIANVKRTTLEILSSCVQQFKRVYVTIHKHANAVKKLHVHLDLNVTVESVKIYAIRSNVALALRAMLESAFAHRDTMETLMTSQQDVRSLDSVKLIKIVKILKFASKTAEASVNVLKVVVKFSADQIHSAQLMTIALLAYALKASKEIL